MDEYTKVFDDVVQALVALRDSRFITPLLTEEKTIQGWIDFCSDAYED